MKNKHKINFYRNAKSFVLAALMFFVLFMPINPALANTLITPDSVAEHTNILRITEKLSPLISNELLMESAQKKAEHMAQNGYFAHEDENGRRLSYWLTDVFYPYVIAGENLAVGFQDTESLIYAWNESPLHRRNLVEPRYQDIGVGVANGVYHSKPGFFCRG